MCITYHRLSKIVTRDTSRSSYKTCATDEGSQRGGGRKSGHEEETSLTEILKSQRSLQLI